MKSASAAMKAHIAGEVTTLCTCWKLVRRDGTAYYFTDHDSDLVVDGQTYQAALSYARSAVSGAADMSPDNMEMQGVIDSADIKDSDLRAGLFDHAEYWVFMVNHQDLTMDRIKLRHGWIGEVSHGLTQYNATLLGITQRLGNNIGKLYSPLCRATFGDFFCKVDVVNTYTFNASVGAVFDRRRFAAVGLLEDGPKVTTYSSNLINFKPLNIIQDLADGFGVFSPGDIVEITGSRDNDGTRVFFTVASGVVAVEGLGVNKEGVGPTVTFTKRMQGYYEQGVLTWLTGANAGLSMEVRGWTNNKQTVASASAAAGVVTVHTTAAHGYIVGDTVVTVDGTFVIASVPDSTTFTYANPSTALTPGASVSVNELKLELQMPNPIAAGDTFRVTAGCDKTWGRCIFFNNAANFRGEPTVPGIDAALDYPNAQ